MLIGTYECLCLVEPPSPQEFAPLHSQAVGGAPRLLEINASHDMYLCFGPQFPDGQTLYRYASDFIIHFGRKTLANNKQMGGDRLEAFFLSYHRQRHVNSINRFS